MSITGVSMQDRADAQPSILASVTEIVSAQLANNAMSAAEVPAFIRSVHATLCELEGVAAGVPASRAAAPQPAVPIDQSVCPDHIVCLEDGKKLRMLKRYLMAQYGLTPEAYRAKWNLPRTYPMVAPAVSEQRRASAREAGLGKAAAAKGRRRSR